MARTRWEHGCAVTVLGFLIMYGHLYCPFYYVCLIFGVILTCGSGFMKTRGNILQLTLEYNCNTPVCDPTSPLSEESSHPDRSCAHRWVP